MDGRVSIPERGIFIFFVLRSLRLCCSLSLLSSAYQVSLPRMQRVSGVSLTTDIHKMPRSIMLETSPQRHLHATIELCFVIKSNLYLACCLHAGYSLAQLAASVQW